MTMVIENLSGGVADQTSYMTSNLINFTFFLDGLKFIDIKQ
jgi:hypothetical protein